MWRGRGATRLPALATQRPLNCAWWPDRRRNSTSSLATAIATPWPRSCSTSASARSIRRRSPPRSTAGRRGRRSPRPRPGPPGSSPAARPGTSQCVRRGVRRGGRPSPGRTRLCRSRPRSGSARWRRSQDTSRASEAGGSSGELPATIAMSGRRAPVRGSARARPTRRPCRVLTSGPAVPTSSSS